MTQTDSPLLRQLDDLELSPDRTTATLLRQVFWRAAASSPAALAETTASYERLLLHARDAARAGRAVSREEVRRFTGVDDAQLVLWELVARPGDCLLSVRDIPALTLVRRSALAACRADDARVSVLRSLLGDGIPSLVFAVRRATVRYLRDRLHSLQPAWCTGTAAGIGPLCAPRATVFDWFRTDAPTNPLAPRLLITTDVAAEGLDLSRLRRVVHYDLPWTPARIEQREGRSRRGHHAHLSTSQVVPVSPELEQRLRLAATLAHKRTLPPRVGVGPDSNNTWRLRESLAALLGDGPRIEGVAAISGVAPGLIAGLEIIELASSGSGTVVGRSVLGTSGRHWHAEEEAIATLRWAAVQMDAATPITPGERRAARALLAQAVRARLRQHEAAAWWRRNDPAARILLQRLYAMVRPASRARDRETLAMVERAIRFAGGGHTAGERVLIQDLAGLAEAALTRRLSRLPPPSGGSGLLSARLTGLIIIRDGELPFPRRRDTFGAHDPLRHPPVRPGRHADQLGEADPGQLSPHPPGARHTGAQ